MSGTCRIVPDWRLNFTRKAILALSLATVCLPTDVARGTEAAGAARKHPISITQIDAFVDKSRLTLRCSFYGDDLEMLYDIWPDEETGLYDSGELRESFDLHAEFLLENIEIVDAAGNRLTGKLVEKGPFEIPEAGIQSSDLMEYLLTLTFEYPYDEPPEFLTFRHDINDPNFTRPAEVSLIVKQTGSDVPYSANMKPRTPETVRFDWNQPLSKTATGDELRDWFDRQREETLGITSYGGVYVFVYVTPHETRQEVLIPLAILASEVRLAQADPSYLEVEEQKAAIPAIKEFFSSGNPLSINGETVSPRFDRIDFGGLDIRDFALRRDPVRVSMANGRVGVIMAYPTRKLPDRVEYSWNRFNQKFLRDVDVVAITPQGTERAEFSFYLADNRWSWQNPGMPPLPPIVEVAAKDQLIDEVRTPLPLVSIVCGFAAVVVMLSSLLTGFRSRHLAILVVPLVIAAATWQVRYPVRLPGAEPPRMTPEQGEQIFDELLLNMFRAFDYSGEEDVYDALAASTSGPMLREVYLKMRKSLEIQEQGGSVATIDKVEILDGRLADELVVVTAENESEPLESPDFAWRSRWNLSGTVEHWGHIHRRTNQYEAVFNVRNVDGQWKFTGYRTIDEKQGPVVRSIRKF